MSETALANSPCHDHPDTRSLYHCGDCSAWLCHRCVETQFHGQHSSVSCRRCRGLAQELIAERSTPEEKNEPALADNALLFPLRGSNWTYFLGCTLLLLVAEANLLWVACYPVTVRVGYRRSRHLWILLLLFLVFNLVQVIAEAAKGSAKAPRWLNPFGGRDNPVPWASTGMILGIGAVAFAPALAAWLLGGEATALWMALALVFAAAYLPVALIATALDCTVGFRLDRLPSEVARFGSPYLIHALGLAAVMALFAAGLALIVELESWGLLLIHAPLVAYAAMLSMRGLGELFRRNERRLDWF